LHNITFKEKSQASLKNFPAKKSCGGFQRYFSEKSVPAGGSAIF